MPKLKVKMDVLVNVHPEMRVFSQGQGRCPDVIGINHRNTLKYFEDLSASG